MTSKLEQGLDALRAVNALGGASLDAVCGATRLPARTARPLMAELLHLGYVALDESGRYVPTGRCLQLSEGYDLPTRLAQIAEPSLAAFGARIGWPSHLAVFERDAMTVVLASGGFSVMATNRGVGTRGPMLVSSNGRAYLGCCPDTERAQILERLRASDAAFDQPAHDQDKVHRLLRTVRRQGYATSDASYVREVYGGLLHGISVPIRLQGRVVAAVNVMFLRKVLSLRAGVASLLPELQGVAGRIAQDLAQELGRAAARAG